MHGLNTAGAGIGSIMLAFSINSLGSWTKGYVFASVFIVIIFIMLIVAGKQWTDKPAVRSEAMIQKEKSVSFLTLISHMKLRGVPAACIAFYLNCSMELMFMVWGSSYIVFVKGLDAGVAATVMTLFTISMIIGRFSAGGLSFKLKLKEIIRGGLVLIALGLVLIIISQDSFFLLVAGFAITSLGFAPLSPSLLGRTGDHFGASNTQAIISLQLSSGFLGNALMPLIFGMIASAIGYTLFPVILLTMWAVLTTTLEVLNRMSAKNT
jgi:fucose permease